MNTQLNSKTLILTIIKFVFGMLTPIAFFFLPFAEGTPFVYYTIVYLIEVLKGNLEQYLLECVPMVIMTIFTVVALVKNILIFVAVIKVSKGKFNKGKIVWNKKFELADYILTFIFFVVTLALWMKFTLFTLYHFYVVLTLLIGDLIVKSMLKKQLKITKKDKQTATVSATNTVQTTETQSESESNETSQR